MSVFPYDPWDLCSAVSIKVLLQSRWLISSLFDNNDAVNNSTAIAITAHSCSPSQQQSTQS